MSWQATTHVVDHSKHKGSALLLLIMVANHAHSDGTGAYPSIATLATETRMSERQVRRNLRVLEESGELMLCKSPSVLGTNEWVVVGVKLSPGGQTDKGGGDITVSAKPSTRTSRVRTSPTERAPRAIPVATRGSEKAAIISEVARALERHNTPPLDERLKSILASQVGNLLKRGYSEAVIQDEAVRLAMAWTPTKGHRLAFLQANVTDHEAKRHTSEYEADKIGARCANRECVRLALRGREHCSSHDVKEQDDRITFGAALRAIV